MISSQEQTLISQEEELRRIHEEYTGLQNDIALFMETSGSSDLKQRCESTEYANRLLREELTLAKTKLIAYQNVRVL